MDPKKRTLGADERDDAARQRWKERIARLPVSRMVFLDESGANITLARRYGRAPRGTRSYGSAPRNYGENLTLIASLSVEGIDAPMLLDGAVDGTAFTQYVKHFLIPSLRPGQFVILDNLAVHKQIPIRRMIRAAGCWAIFLPSYSPDFNPIEMAFSKIKAYLRRVGARTKESLEEAIGEAIDLVSARDARGYFHHCGYLTMAQ